MPGAWHLLFAGLLVFACILPAAATVTAIPPVLLQGCAEKVKPAHFGLVGGLLHGSAGGRGARAVGFDVSFMNVSKVSAVLVLLRIGETDFAKTGIFTTGVNIAWRLAAIPGPCSIEAVRFSDGSEWVKPTPTPSTTP